MKYIMKWGANVRFSMALTLYLLNFFLTSSLFFSVILTYLVFIFYNWMVFNKFIKGCIQQPQSSFRTFPSLLKDFLCLFAINPTPYLHQFWEQKKYWILYMLNIQDYLCENNVCLRPLNKMIFLSNEICFVNFYFLVKGSLYWYWQPAENFWLSSCI